MVIDLVIYYKFRGLTLLGSKDPVSAGNGAPLGVDINKPLKNFKDALRWVDAAEWVEAYRKEGQGFQNRDALDVVRSLKGTKILNSITRTEYKNEMGVLGAHEGISKSTILMTGTFPYSRHPKSGFSRRLLLCKADTKQVFLYGDMDNDNQVYVRPPDCQC